MVYTTNIILKSVEYVIIYLPRYLLNEGRLGM